VKCKTEIEGDEEEELFFQTKLLINVKEMVLSNKGQGRNKQLLLAG
jgi:hypothetical protein